jgi:hypothetical protein
MSKVGVTVSYRYSNKMDANQKDSPWAGAEVTYSIEQDGPGEFDVNKIAEGLFGDAKTQVFAQLGVEFTVDENGAIQPVVPVADIPKKVNTGWKKTLPSPGGKPDYSNLPRVTVKGVEYIDFRTAKQDGTVKPRFPDFKTTDLREGFYITLPDGETQSAFGQMLAEEGVLV